MNATVPEHLVDVSPLPPRERHPKILGTWEGLAPGEAILLVNDHDPVPLYYQFAVEHTGTFRWEYLEQGPDVFRVRISKGEFADPGFVPAARSAISIGSRALRSSTVFRRCVSSFGAKSEGFTPAAI